MSSTVPSASAGGRLATVIRPSPLVVDLAQASHPPAWVPVSYQPGSIVPRGSGSEFVDLDIPRGGRYTVWLGGSLRKRVTVFIDGREAGSAVGTLDPSSGYFALGEVDLTRAHHRIELRYGGPELRPGSGGEPFAMGPLTLSTTNADLPIRYVDPAQAHSLCGKNLDWIEAVQG